MFWTVLTAISGVIATFAALGATWFAWRSARASKASVEPLRQIAADMAESTRLVQHALDLTRLQRREDRLAARLARLARLRASLNAVVSSWRANPNSDNWGNLQGLVAHFRALLSSFTSDELPACFKLADANVSAIKSPLEQSNMELLEKLNATQRELADAMAKTDQHDARTTEG